jgi:hypothetical protein
MPDLRRRHERSARRRLVEVLAEVPRTAVVLAPLLQIAARHVQADGVAENVLVGALRVDAAPAFGERDHELGLVVVIRSLRRIAHLAAVGHERVCALDEEKRLLAAVAAHLLLMLGIVASDAEDAPHRKRVRGARDRQHRRAPQRNCMTH